jgi:nucleotidyltransferase substrate binding protein (TIGR01987 family)
MMGENQDIRWRQRHSNLVQTLELLNSALAIPEPDIVQKAGIIQFFEISFELAWKTLKDYLEFQGYSEVRSPREAVKKAFEIGLIKDGHGWMSLINDRNLTAHTYDQARISAVEGLIRERYRVLLSELSMTLDALKND